MPLGMVSGVGRWMGALNGGSERGRGEFEGSIVTSEDFVA